MTAEENGSWMSAYAIALPGRTVTFHGGYGTVAVEHNSDHSYTASVRPAAGDTDIRAFTSAAPPRTWPPSARPSPPTVPTRPCALRGIPACAGTSRS